MRTLAKRHSYGVVQMKKKAILTIPKEVRLALHLADEGELFEIIVDNGKIILEPKTLIPKEQEWFWTERWQAGEREAEEDIKAGRVSPAFDNVKDLLEALNNED
ncbi:AbrB family transcriptional regulator [Desulfitobacterium sp. LBE]|uniref:AbrB family transcriptional regulator n=4 Tax=root TaxID=1 RepID=A0A098AV03_DESHA|nr:MULTISPECIES: AbrB/MazE/SpoVT family DNA-binding domain-containing protein [Desulfitobacterium]ACL18389.1 transcriptional regulator, AbrB family [Desulfitobacterium hafniense DCB-2]KTE91658.1 AbrB family transcriptional regulator [Desulfitobacterium hafniense]MEA5023677.1 AbrB/MazE/SpoVT family DNA-binding domain-containing protein [Desulfitobacterium hafniense]TWH58683.1 AbrB family transcriptional regulator [Desulfitobacterium sp. LBE]CDX00373.1 Antidote-toxin recognition MazE [Desulfitob